MKDKSRLGAVIKQLRESMNISQAQLAEIIGKSTGTIGQYERGEIFPNYEALSKIVEFFDVDANIFFERNESHYPIESILMFNLFSQMKDSEKAVIAKFHKDFARLLNFLENNQSTICEDEDVT